MSDVLNVNVVQLCYIIDILIHTTVNNNKTKACYGDFIITITNLVIFIIVLF